MITRVTVELNSNEQVLLAPQRTSGTAFAGAILLALRASIFQLYILYF